jgi:hypothetical protein
MIHRIGTETVPDIWPLVIDLAREAMKVHPFMDETDLLTTILAGHAQLFVVTKDKAFLGFAAVEVLQYPRCRVANVLAAGGHRGFLSVSVQQLMPEMESWAQEHGADIFAVHGRPGWLKVSKVFAGSRQQIIGIAWRPLGYERRRTERATDAGERAVGGRATLPHPKLQ